MGLTKAAISRPIFILMLMIAALLMGTLSYKSMRLELNPDVSFGTVTISTSYPGAGPDDINELVSRKIEQAVSGVNGMREVTSTSQEGSSVVIAQLELGVDVDAAVNDIRSKVDSIVNQLPKDALKPQVTKVDTSAKPILTLNFSSSTLNAQQLRDLIDDKLADRFAQINGVASTTVNGGDTREIQVRVRRDKLMEYGIGIADLQKAVSNGTVNSPSGKLVSGSKEFSVRVKNDYQTLKDVAGMVITISDPKSPNTKVKTVHLRDVATIEDTVQERTTYARLDGKDSISITIQKAKEGNAVEITATAMKIKADIEKEYKAQGVKLEKTYDDSKQITESLEDLNFALGFGIFLVSIIVFIFLHNLRGTIIVATAIPTSIFATFIAMKLFGFTINNMSMLSLSLAIGVLVDDAIVVLENIYRHLRMGEDPREAAINGRAEIGLAALAITFADVVVFLPIAFMGGIVGQFFKPLAVGFVFATLMSLFVSFTVTPLLASRWYRAGEDMEHPKGMFAQAFEKVFGRLERGYGRTLEWALNHRWFVFLTGNVALFAVFMFIGGSFMPTTLKLGEALGSAVGMSKSLMMMAVIIGVITTVVNTIRFRRFSLKYVLAAAAFACVFPAGALVGWQYHAWKKGTVFQFGFLPITDSGKIQATIELPPGASLESTESVVKRVEEAVMSHPDVKYTLSNIGKQGEGGQNAATNVGSNYAVVSATLFERASIMERAKGIKATEHVRTAGVNSVAADITQRVDRIPGAKVRVTAASEFNFGSAVQLSFTSDNREALLKTVTDVRDGLLRGEIKGVINPDISSKPGKPEIRVIPDRVALADNGVDPSSVGGWIRTLYQGDDSTKLRVNGREYVVRTMLDLNDRNNIDILTQIPVTFKQGNPVLVSTVATIGSAPGVDKITRRNRSEEIQVTADLLPGFANGSVAGEIDHWLKDKNLVKEGVLYRPLGEADAQGREMGFLFSALGLGFVLVYMLLASLYDNLLYPFIIQLAQPQAMVGALLALILTDKTFNLIGFIGIISLVGLVGKNAILLVDYTNTLRGRGRNRHDALVEAGPTRLRPITMTTIALILGMLPVALAIGKGSEFRETIGITIIGGITLSTMLTLLVIPCSYTIFDDMSEGLRSTFKNVGRLFGRGDDGLSSTTAASESEQKVNV